MKLETVPFGASKLGKRLREALHGMFLVLGSGQHGKTVSINALFNEDHFIDRDVALVNYDPEFVKRIYPKRYRAVEWPDDPKKVKDLFSPSEDCVIIDDAAFLVSARDSATRESKDLQKLFTIVSHMELYVAVVLQSMALGDISIVQSQDLYLLHKHMDIMALSFERSQILPYQAMAELMITKYQSAHPEIHPKAWTYSGKTQEILISELPPFWTPEHSKPFKYSAPWR